MPEHHPETDVHIIGSFLAEHTPQLKDPVLRGVIIRTPNALLSMGFLMGLMFQAQAPFTAESILAAIPPDLRDRDDAINGLVNALTAARVARRKAAEE